MLEDLDLASLEVRALEEWANLIAGAIHPEHDAQQDLVARLSVVPDDIMSFLAETATEVRARVRIDPTTGTVSRGALWYEEHLPAETLRWGLFAVSDSNNALDARPAGELRGEFSRMDDIMLQLGGNASVGQGLMRFLADGGRA